MTHWRKFNKRMDPRFLYAEDIGPPGTMLDVEIVDAGGDKVKNPGGSKECTALTLAGQQKRLGLNATNAKCIETLFGTPEFESWRGWITLVVVRSKQRDPTQEGGAMVEMDVIRIAPQRPTRPDVRAQPQPHPLAMRFDACSSEREFVALEAEMRSDWATIPKGAARTAVGDAALRARAKYATVAPAASSAPSPEEQAAIAAEEAKLT